MVKLPMIIIEMFNIDIYRDGLFIVNLVMIFIYRDDSINEDGFYCYEIDQLMKMRESNK